MVEILNHLPNLHGSLFLHLCAFVTMRLVREGGILFWGCPFVVTYMIEVSEVDTVCYKPLGAISSESIFTTLVHLGTKMKWLDLEVIRSQFKVSRRPNNGQNRQRNDCWILHVSTGSYHFNLIFLRVFVCPSSIHHVWYWFAVVLLLSAVWWAAAGVQGQSDKNHSWPTQRKI